mmetsp:Transcript_42168/g.90584  ORF Transcript_42168/g.90584 Transcript_42168/m.90584 type:complete len:464 (-) Transcript_42168:305-1696(-)|eukprot:CAMPEP_0206456936 /NCGR_PEP_ID=MMETSP0324_2-20121206/22662_1 /ASSEMBLY_ACC=CAM_ASM_000836 /TAXON_ID=2866 /ORGANISM="Crypthecodinium cohnii, Strain Seligo" /LENGTH=463 /DNA_ID=CAMNT_0053927961 /DNA_START=45 /DNA_END=1436 /DNA_ORIENTATION=+
MAPADKLQDCFGLELSTGSEPCVNAINQYYEAVLAYKPFSAWAISEDAVAADKSSPMARILAADYAICRGDAARAKELLEECSKEVADADWSWREQRYLDAWKKWGLEADFVGCFEILKEVVEKHPTDLFAVKRGQIMGLILGEGKRILSIVEIAAKHAASSPPPRYLHGMWSFGLEQEGQYEEAEKKSREGLEFEDKLGPDAWLHHSLAHSLYFQGEDRIDDSLEFLESRSSTWNAETLHPFLFTHNWWHLALVYTEKRNFEKALSIFHEQLWTDKNKEMQKDPQVQLNALNLLWRLDTRGKQEVTKPLWAQVIDGCAGTTLPGADGAKAPCQHSDLLLDILLLRGFCAMAGGNGNTGPLQTWLEQIRANAKAMAAGSGEGAAARAEAYESCANCVADLFDPSIKEAEVPLKHDAAKKRLRELQPRWGALGGSEEQRSILLEAIEGPLVAGSPEANYDTLFR